jgi:hypothetical protein
MTNIKELSRTTRLALRILSAKADITNLGYPEIVSRLFYEKFGNLAPLMAKWYKNHKAAGREDDPDWWRRMWSARAGYSLPTLTYLYEHSGDLKTFLEACEHEDVQPMKGLTQETLQSQRDWLVNRLRDELFGERFFTHYSLITDIMSGKLKDIAPYKRLRFYDAQKKYEKRRYFQESEPIKVYENGFRWIDVGPRSEIIHEQMKNCGSSGVMSLDKDRTIIALFGPNGKPHVMVTYSPNEKRISGDECAGSTAVKPEYHQYVMDLADQLGAKFDVHKSKSPELAIKYRLRNVAQSIETLSTNKYGFDSYFRFVVNGRAFYTDGARVASEEEVNRAGQMIKSGELKSNYPPEEAFKDILNGNNRYKIEDAGIHVVPLREFLGEGSYSEYGAGS